MDHGDKAAVQDQGVRDGQGHGGRQGGIGEQGNKGRKIDTERGGSLAAKHKRVTPIRQPRPDQREGHGAGRWQPAGQCAAPGTFAGTAKGPREGCGGARWTTARARLPKSAVMTFRRIAGGLTVATVVLVVASAPTRQRVRQRPPQASPPGRLADVGAIGRTPCVRARAVPRSLSPGARRGRRGVAAGAAGGRAGDHGVRV